MDSLSSRERNESTGIPKGIEFAGPSIREEIAGQKGNAEAFAPITHLNMDQCMYVRKLPEAKETTIGTD